jgi:hypothetical protein
LRLEPISFDADLRALAKENEIIAHNEPIVIAILKDPKIFKVYHETIQTLTREILDEKRLQEKLELIEQKHLAYLRKEFYFLEKYPYDKLKNRAKYLLTLSENGFKEHKKPPEGFPTLIHAYRITDTNKSYLELANAIPYEVEVGSINWIKKGDRRNIKFQPLSTQSFPIHLAPTPPGSLPETHRIYYSTPSDAASYFLEVTTSIQGQKQPHKIIAKPYHPALKQNPVPVSTVSEQLSQHPFLALNRRESSLFVQPGIWQVVGSLVVPVGTRLKIPAGTTLRFLPSEGLFSHGPLDLLGTEDAPIILEGILSESNENSWQGVAVLNANSSSVWTHVIVRNTAGISRAGWQLTGGVTFYKSDIRMNHCRLQGNRGEDALNIIHSKFELNGIEILETASDGFDADFADGVIKDSIFQNIGKAGGGDAIDISGSEVFVTGSRFLDISDKALSVGEQSKMTANKVSIENAGTGAACKDGSHLDITDSSIRDSHNAGLMAYVKKAEFGPAQIEANNVTLVGNESEGRVQKGSSITLNGKHMEGEDLDVEELYRTIMKPGLQR